jgi:hypothetical protein
MCGESWCNQSYTKPGLNRGEDGLDDRGPEHGGHDHIIKRMEETILVQGVDGWVG